MPQTESVPGAAESTNSTTPFDDALGIQKEGDVTEKEGTFPLAPAPGGGHRWYTSGLLFPQEWGIETYTTSFW